MMNTTAAVLLRPTARRTAARALAAGARRTQCACAASGMVRGEFEARGEFLGHFQRDGSFCEDLVYSLSLASSLERDLESDNIYDLMDERMKEQLQNSYDALLSSSTYDVRQLRSRLPPETELSFGELNGLAKKKIERKLPPLEEKEEAAIIAEQYAQPLPSSINDVTSSKLDEDPRAIVVTDTKSPYRILTVNTAWENLCGYPRGECHGRSLGRLLQGPETDVSTVTAMLSKLLAGEEAGALLTNYTKDGRKFLNNIRVRPVKDEMGKTVNFVGVLREVKDEGDASDFGGDGLRRQLPFMA